MRGGQASGPPCLHDVPAGHTSGDVGNTDRRGHLG